MGARWLALMVGLLGAGTAAAEGLDAPLSTPPLVEAEVPLPAKPKELPKFGVLVDVGVPDGAGAAVLYRPIPWLRVGAGAMTNAVSAGIRGGLTVVPFRGWISPSLTVEGGHFFQGDANGLARKISGDSTFNSELLQGFSYDYANAHLGLELGSQRRFSFFLHAGMSRIWLDVPNVSQALNAATSQTWSAAPIHIQLDAVSAKLGFVLFFG